MVDFGVHCSDWQDIVSFDVYNHVCMPSSSYSFRMQELRESASVVVESTKVIYGNALEHLLCPTVRVCVT